MRLLIYPLLSLGLIGADWPQFRGLNGSGLCGSCDQLPVEFGPEKNVLWKTALPEGKSSPVLVGDRIFLTASEGDDLITISLSRATGAIQWRRSIRAAKREFQHSLNHRAAPTAVTDGKTVFVFFADFGLAAYDFEGNERWRLPLGPFNSQHGIVASPVYADGRVILVFDTDTDAYIIGVDAATGKIAWKTPRLVINGYSTPVIHRPARGPAQVIAPGSYQLTAYSVVDGEPRWFVRGLTCQPKSAPTIAGDIVYFNGWTVGNDSGEQVELPAFAEVIAAADANRDGKLAQKELPQPWQPTGTWRAIDLDRDGFLNEREWTFFRTRRASRNALFAVKLGGSGDVTDTHVLWRFEKSLPDVPTPLVYKDVVYLFRSGGIATTLDARTGKVLKQARLAGALEDYYSSPVAAGDKVYIASEHGKVVVLRAGGDWEILAINEFDADIYATPAVIEGKIYIRTRNALYAIGQQAARRIISPELLAGNRITFRISAPKAAEVSLRFPEGAAPQLHPMTKGEDGVWSVTIGPAAPEIYTYSFLVDGVKTIDLSNPVMKVGATIDASVVDVPGDPPRFDQVQAVPHGSVNIHTYASAVSRTQRGLYVYVPPDYYAQPSKRFPVLYLWHGGGGAEQDWSRDGRAGVILDNLIAQKKAVPMLIVMPNNVPGTPAPGVAASGARPVPATGAGGANYPMLKRELLDEIIPFAARHYRTIENRESRAIAGLSAGGGTTMNVGLPSLDTFAWVAEFSSGIFGGAAAAYAPFDMEKIAPGFYADPAAVNKKLKLFYMSCGTEDPRMPFQKKALEEFRSHQIKVTFAEFPGAHEWKVWRHSLADLAVKLFR